MQSSRTVWRGHAHVGFLFLVAILLLGVTNVQGETGLQNLALRAPYWVNIEPNSSYPDQGGELTDGVKGPVEYGHGAWQGHLRSEFRVVTIDLGAPKQVSHVEVGFLHETSVGIFLPDQVLLETSVNGKEWTEPVSVQKAELGRLTSPTRYTISFKGVNRAARYVRVVFFVEAWVFIDEIEVWGDPATLAVEGATDLLDMNDPYLGLHALPERSVWSGDALPEPTNAYMPMGSPEAAGVRHMMLIYTHTDANGSGWYVGKAMPYVAYGTRANVRRISPPRWEDWYFDSFLFLSLYTQRGGSFASVARGGAPGVWQDWMWFLDYLFKKDEQLNAFELAVERAKGFIDDPDYKAKVVIMIPYPMTSITDFGDPNGTGTSLSFTSYRQGAEAQTKARLAAVDAYLDELQRRWDERGFEHLELVGLYWLAEEINSAADFDLLQHVGKTVNERGYKLFWIPYFKASGWAQWKEAGFDAVMYQPNYMFRRSTPHSRLQEAAEGAFRYGMGVELEADETVLTDSEGRERYLAYLQAGVEHGFMNQALHGYYQGLDVLFHAFASTDPEVRHIYDATYQYVKGVYGPESD